MGNNINILNMVAVSLLQVKKWRWGKLSQISQGKSQLQNIANLQMKVLSNYVVFYCQNDFTTQKNM